ncbi:hypothetical protein SO694_0000736 [Aureococcus anophagefferens]|uniref:SRCR domain-containing protein n=1 Tax=Aureococcus anophagefferens TaxID=44056 RepID=A0ABR1GB18_AURAN
MMVDAFELWFLLLPAVARAGQYGFIQDGSTCGTVVTYTSGWYNVCDDGWDIVDAHVFGTDYQAYMATANNYFGSAANDGNFVYDDVGCYGYENYRGVHAHAHAQPRQRRAGGRHLRHADAQPDATADAPALDGRAVAGPVRGAVCVPELDAVRRAVAGPSLGAELRTVAPAVRRAVAGPVRGAVCVPELDAVRGAVCVPELDAVRRAVDPVRRAVFGPYYQAYMATTNNYFSGPRTTTATVDGVGCYGSENYLAACTSTSSHNCGDGEQAGVICITPTPNPTTAAPSPPRLRRAVGVPERLAERRTVAPAVRGAVGVPERLAELRTVAPAVRGAVDAPVRRASAPSTRRQRRRRRPRAPRRAPDRRPCRPRRRRRPVRRAVGVPEHPAVRGAVAVPRASLSAGPSPLPTASFVEITSMGTESTCVADVECELLWVYRGDSGACATLTAVFTDPDGNVILTESQDNDGQETHRSRRRNGVVHARADGRAVEQAQRDAVGSAERGAVLIPELDAVRRAICLAERGAVLIPELGAVILAASATTGARFPCAEVLDFDGADRATCYWIDASLDAASAYALAVTAEDAAAGTNVTSTVDLAVAARLSSSPVLGGDRLRRPGLRRARALAARTGASVVLDGVDLGEGTWVFAVNVTSPDGRSAAAAVVYELVDDDPPAVEVDAWTPSVGARVAASKKIVLYGDAQPSSLGRAVSTSRTFNTTGARDREHDLVLAVGAIVAGAHYSLRLDATLEGIDTAGSASVTFYVARPPSAAAPRVAAAGFALETTFELSTRSWVTEDPPLTYASPAPSLASTLMTLSSPNLKSSAQRLSPNATTPGEVRALSLDGAASAAELPPSLAGGDAYDAFPAARPSRASRRAARAREAALEDAGGAGGSGAGLASVALTIGGGVARNASRPPGANLTCACGYEGNVSFACRQRDGRRGGLRRAAERHRGCLPGRGDGVRGLERDGGRVALVLRGRRRRRRRDDARACDVDASGAAAPTDFSTEDEATDAGSVYFKNLTEPPDLSRALIMIYALLALLGACVAAHARYGRRLDARDAAAARAASAVAAASDADDDPYEVNDDHDVLTAGWKQNFLTGMDLGHPFYGWYTLYSASVPRPFRAWCCGFEILVFMRAAFETNLLFPDVEEECAGKLNPETCASLKTVLRGKFKGTHVESAPLCQWMPCAEACVMEEPGEDEMSPMSAARRPERGPTRRDNGRARRPVCKIFAYLAENYLVAPVPLALRWRRGSASPAGAPAARAASSPEDEPPIPTLKIDWHETGAPEASPGTLASSAGPESAVADDELLRKLRAAVEEPGGAAPAAAGDPAADKEPLEIKEIKERPDGGEARARVDALLAARARAEINHRSGASDQTSNLSSSAHALLEGGPPDARESQAPIPEGGAADGDATGFAVSCSVQCDGAACVAPAGAAHTCLSSTLDDAFAVPSMTAACLFGLDRLEDEVSRARVAEARPAAAKEAAPVDDGDLVVPEMGEWVESLVGDLDARLEPTDVEPLASGPGRGATASPHLSLASLARGISRAKFAARRATSRRTLCSDSSKTTGELEAPEEPPGAAPYIARVGGVLCVVLYCFYYLLTTGSQFGRKKTRLWLEAVTFSLVLYFVFIKPIVVLLISVIMPSFVASSDTLIEEVFTFLPLASGFVRGAHARARIRRGGRRRSLRYGRRRRARVRRLEGVPRVREGDGAGRGGAQRRKSDAGGPAFRWPEDEAPETPRPDVAGEDEKSPEDAVALVLFDDGGDGDRVEAARPTTTTKRRRSDRTTRPPATGVLDDEEVFLDADVQRADEAGAADAEARGRGAAQDDREAGTRRRAAGGRGLRPRVPRREDILLDVDARRADGTGAADAEARGAEDAAVESAGDAIENALPPPRSLRLSDYVFSVQAKPEDAPVPSYSDAAYAAVFGAAAAARDDHDAGTRWPPARRGRARARAGARPRARAGAGWEPVEEPESEQEPEARPPRDAPRPVRRQG